MANPQKENGYAPLANEILEHLALIDITGSEFRCVLVLIRKTYGFNKKQDKISLTQWQKFTKLSRPTVIKSLKNLISRGILCKKDGKFYLNKDWEKWCGKSVFTSKSVFTDASKGVFTDASKGVFTYKRHVLKTYIKYNENNFKSNLIKAMEYELIDENGNPLRSKNLKKITKEQNNFVISIGFMWVTMAHKHTGMPEDQIPIKNIAYVIRKCWDREKYLWKRDDFKNLFEYFFKDKKIADETKLSFDFCLSEKYVAQYKLKQMSKPKTTAHLSSEIRL